MKRRKLFRKILCIILAILMLGSLCIGIITSLITSARASQELDELEAQQEANREEREELEAQQEEIIAQRYQLQCSISDISKTISTIQEEKNTYDRMIVLAEEEIENIGQQIVLLEEQIEYKKLEYDEAVAAEEEQWEIFKVKLRAMEERGNVSYLEILFEDVNGFGDLLGRLDMINEIVGQDEGVIDEMEQAKQEVALAQQELYNARDDLNIKQDEQEQKKVELAALVEEASARIKDLEDEKAAQQADAQELQERINELERQIKEEEAEDARIAAQIKELERLEKLKNAGVTATGTYLWPSSDSYYVTSLFGMRFHPILKYWRSHNGIDIGASYGTNIYASDGGIVVTSSYNESYGNYVMIAHGNGRYTLYAHMSQRLVSVDDTVSQGSVIGLVGSTGYSTGPHIHFEIYENDVRVDPLQFFSNYVIWD